MKKNQSHEHHLEGSEPLHKTCLRPVDDPDDDTAAGGWDRRLCHAAFFGAMYVTKAGRPMEMAYKRM